MSSFADFLAHSLTCTLTYPPLSLVQEVHQSFVLPRLYADVQGHVTKPSAAYSPAYEFGLEVRAIASGMIRRLLTTTSPLLVRPTPFCPSQELAAGVGALYPPSLTLDPEERSRGLRWWDSARRLVSASLRVTASDLQLSLIPATTTFGGPGSLSSAAAAIVKEAREASTREGEEFWPRAAEEEDVMSAVDEEMHIQCAELSLHNEGQQVAVDVQGVVVTQV